MSQSKSGWDILILTNMKISYNSIWSKIYKFNTGNSNEEMSDDFFTYWFIVLVGTLSLPFTLPSIIIDKYVPELKWNYMLRLFVGLVLWALLASVGIIYYTFNLTGNLVVLWTIGVYMFGFLAMMYLCTVQFPIIGDYFIHAVYLLIKYAGLLLSKIKLRPRIEFDKDEVYIIIDRNSIKVLGPITYYYEIVDHNMMHIVVPIKGADIEEYPDDKYLIYTGVKYGNEITKLKLYENNNKKD